MGVIKQFNRRVSQAVSHRNRRKKWNQFMDRFQPSRHDWVLDVGFQDREFREPDNFIEKHYPYPGQLVALGLDSPDQFRIRYPRVGVIRYGGGDFPFCDKAFDIGWSNAVIEHVGTEEDQVMFLREMARSCRKFFLTTPNRYFPVEVHTRSVLLHFLPKPWFEAFLRLIGKSWATGNYMRLLGSRDLRRMLKKAGISKAKIIRNRWMGFTMDFSLVVESTSP